VAKGTLKVKIMGDASHLNKTLTGAGVSLKGLGKAALAAGAVVGAAFVGIGVFALKSAVDLDKAYDTIRTGTGATGKDLDALKTSFKTVFKGVPASAETVGTAMADLNTRTGQTGKGLEDLTKQAVLLAKITKTDVGTVVASTTRVFGDWSIATKDQSKTMDYLFKVSQHTGVGVDKLAQTVVEFGAPLRQLGFDFETSAAMLGKWEKEGVNTTTVLSGMKIGLANMAVAGKDAKTGMLEAISSIKEAGTQAEANSLAIKIFGKRAGPDMAAAIREGRFELDDLLAVLEASPETINTAAEATYDFGEKWTMTKNKLETVFEPLGIKLMNILGKLADWVDQHMPEIEKAFATGFATLSRGAKYFYAEVWPVLLKSWKGLKEWWATNGPEVKRIAGETFQKMIDLGTWLMADVLPVLADALLWVADEVVHFGESGRTAAPLIAGVGAAILTIKVVGLAAALTGAATGLGALGATAAIALGPIGLAAAAIGLLVAGAAALYTTRFDKPAANSPAGILANAQAGNWGAYGTSGSGAKASGGGRSAGRGVVKRSRGITRQFGGPIPGSGPVPITAHGGEYVLTKGDTSLMRGLTTALASGGGGSQVINLTLDLGEGIKERLRLERDAQTRQFRVTARTA
jgi:TP901 family phage tail tape measure protein